MQFLYLLENLRVSWLNELMLLITHLGEETAFLAIAIIVFWCVDKYHGYYLMGVGLFGNMANQFLKILCHVPRPWVKDPNFHALEDAIPEADGYSFPSGHSQTAVGTFGCIAVTQKNKIIRSICIAIMILVPFSRMYVGVHTPADVLVGSAMALIMVFALKSVMLGEKKERNIPIVFAALLVLNIAYLIAVNIIAGKQQLTVVTEESENITSAVKNGYTFLGCFAGLLVVWFADEKKLHFSTSAVWWAQILKAVLGLVVVLAVKEGTRSLLEAFLPVYPARAVRYFLVVITAGIIWPLTFKWFSKLGRKEK